jgi:hypothetical protein
LFIVRDGYDYFDRWPSSPEVRTEYQAPLATAARYLSQGDDVSPVSISAPFVDYWSPWSKEGFDILVKRDVPVRWFDGTRSMLFPAGSQARFILPDYVDPARELDADLVALLTASSEQIENDYRGPSGSTLDVYRLQDRRELDQFLASCASRPVWASPEGPYVETVSDAQRQALTLPLRFGDRLLFLGYRYDREQVAPGEVWRMMTCWRVSGSSGEPLAIFVHVLDDANQVRASRDELGVSTTSWQQGDTLVHVHLLSIPPHLAGVQRVELGVYSPVTLERLPILVAHRDEAVPHDRVLLHPLEIK